MNKFTFKDLTTLRIGGKIKYYKEAENSQELIDAVDFANDKRLPIFVIGEGSDILVSEKDFDGVVIKYIGQKLEHTDGLVTAEAGLTWDSLVSWAVSHNLQGIECLSGIPGTVGASVIQNIGAYGQEVKDTFAKLKAYDTRNGEFVEFSNKDCLFSYRESIFKKPANWQKYVITQVTFKLQKRGGPAVKYESLDIYLKKNNLVNPTLQEVRDAVIAIRKTKFEDPKVVGNAGSFFKNPVVDEKKLNSLAVKYPDIKHFGPKISAGWLIEKAGWKGKVHGNAGVSPKHALVLINKTGKATADEIFNLSEKIISDVGKKFGIKLEREVQLINFPGKVAILGYGLEGQDLEKHLKSQGITPVVLDRRFDKNYLTRLTEFEIIYRSPGVYRFLPEIVKAEKSGVKVSSAIKLFFEKCPGKIIGVTGTKGKGTTCSLIYEILKSAGKDVYLAGNIGKPYLELLSKLTKDSLVVLEMSSFQLIDMEVSPNISVVLNITSDHMDWHKSQKEYVDAKKNIVSHQDKNDWTLVSDEYALSRNFGKLTRGRVIKFSKDSLGKEFKQNLLLRGEHNLENIAAAVEVSKLLKINQDIILKTVRGFKGLEHRLELVGTINGRSFYNDSFATSQQPTIAAIKSFSEQVTLILGGSDKGLEYSELRREIESMDNIKSLILIGDMGEKIGGGISGKNIFNLGKSTMDEIISKAYEVTPEGGVILFSPASASFDMFENYKDRGNQFKAAVKKLNEKN
jgi:UDP-N-acetylmuramoylalanine--D-glutamate ligase